MSYEVRQPRSADRTRASFRFRGCCARCCCSRSWFFSAVRRAGLRLHGRDLMLADHFGRARSRVGCVVAPRSALARAHARVAVLQRLRTQQLYGRVLSCMRVYGGSLERRCVPSGRADELYWFVCCKRNLHTLTLVPWPYSEQDSSVWGRAHVGAVERTSLAGHCSACVLHGCT